MITNKIFATRYGTGLLSCSRTANYQLSIYTPTRQKVIIAGHHPVEYFRDDTEKSRLPVIHHPNDKDSAAKTPLYYKITLNRSLLGLPWQQRYWAGVLFKRYQPEYLYRPKSVKPRISTRTAIFREASPEVAQIIMQLKEVLTVENVWSEEEYRSMAKLLLGKKALTPSQLQEKRGYYVLQRNI